MFAVSTISDSCTSSERITVGVDVHRHFADGTSPAATKVRAQVPGYFWRTRWLTPVSIECSADDLLVGSTMRSFAGRMGDGCFDRAVPTSFVPCSRG